MNFKTSFLSLILIALPVIAEAQTARNPLNMEPACVTLQKWTSSWNLSDETFYRADGTVFDKRTHAYDANGRKLSDITLRWNPADKDWTTVNQREFRYENGKEILITKNGQLYASKTETYANAEGKPNYSLTFYWNANAADWSVTPSQRSEWFYDTDGRVTTCLKQSINRETKEWNIAHIRILYTYNNEGVLTEELFQSRNGEQEQWTNGGRYAYSKVGDLRDEAISYIYAAEKWIFDGKTVCLYDEQGKLTRCEYFRNNLSDSFDAYSIYSYSEGDNLPVLPETAEIIVSPNPVITSYELTVPNSYFGKTLQMFDISGRQVKAIPVSSQKTQVDVSGLAGGIYILKIGDITQKIVVL